MTAEEVGRLPDRGARGLIFCASPLPG